MSRYEHIPKEQKPPKKPQKELTKPGQYSKEQLLEGIKKYLD